MTTLNLFGKIFRLTFLFIILLEILSFFGYLYPLFGKIAFFIILIITLILTLRKLEYGLYILLAELFIGSKGYLFQLEVNDISISLRIGLFLIILSVWLWQFIKKRDLALRKTNLFYPFILLFLFLGWGVINGFVKGNTFNNLFFDANGWLYFVLIFVFFDIIRLERQLPNILEVLVAAWLALGLKTFFLLFIFSHQIDVALRPLYSWVRTTGVGEITRVDENFYRLFFQSHLYNLIGFFVLVALVAYPYFPHLRTFLSRVDLKKRDWLQRISGLAILSLVTILISFSRSFWLGGLLGFLFLFYVLIFRQKYKVKELLRTLIYLVLILVLSIGFILTNINFPLPKKTDEVYTGTLFTQRASAVTGEVAVASRWSLLGPLSQEILKHPLLGSGFGSTVTFKSFDPRALTTHPSGLYTTYAFEWGWLDIMLKIGFLGLAAYLFLIWIIWVKGWKILKNERLRSQQLTEQGRFKLSLTLGLLLGLVALLVTQGVSPYLNHPLGIGYLILTGAIFEVLEKHN